MKLIKNYYTSEFNKLAILDSNDFKLAELFTTIKIKNLYGETNDISIDNKCLKDIYNALQKMEERTKNA